MKKTQYELLLETLDINEVLSVHTQYHAKSYHTQEIQYVFKNIFWKETHSELVCGLCIELGISATGDDEKDAFFTLVAVVDEYITSNDKEIIDDIISSDLGIGQYITLYDGFTLTKKEGYVEDIILKEKIIPAEYQRLREENQKLRTEIANNKSMKDDIRYIKSYIEKTAEQKNNSNLLASIPLMRTFNNVNDLDSYFNQPNKKSSSKSKVSKVK